MSKEGLRYNEGKLRMDLVPPEWDKALAEVMTKGAEKYEPRNWEKGMAWSKCLASLKRHVLAWQLGEDTDPETGLPHMAHAAWNALALLTYSSTHPELDDRPNKKQVDPRSLKCPKGWKGMHFVNSEGVCAGCGFRWEDEHGER